MRQLDENPFMHPVNQVNDSRDEQAAPIPFEEIVYQRQQQYRNQQPPQFFERGQHLLSQRERTNNQQQFGVPIQDMPSARSLKNQQAQGQGPKQQQQQPFLKNAPFQYQNQQHNTSYNQILQRENGGGMQIPSFGLVQKNCINIFQGDQSNSSVNTFNTNQDLGQHLLRIHPQSLLNSCGSGYSSCTRYDAGTMDEAAPNQPSLYPLHAFLPHSINPQLQLNLNRVNQSKNSQVSTARTHTTDTIAEEEPTTHYRPLSSRMPQNNQFLYRHLDDPTSLPPSERQGQQLNRKSHLNSHRQIKRLTTISEKRQESVEGVMQKSSKVKKKKLMIPQDEGQSHNIVITQKRVQSANGRSRESSQGRDQHRIRKGSPEMEPQGLYKTMVIQKDRVISAATHRGIAGSVNPLKIARRSSQERPQLNDHQEREREFVGQQQFKLQLKVQNPMMIYQTSPTNIENFVQAQQNLISANQSNVSAQNSFLNCGSHGHPKSDQKSNQQISSSTSHVNTSQKQGLPPQAQSSTKKKQQGPKPIGVGRPSNDSAKPGLPHLLPKSHSKLKAAPLPPHTVSSKKTLQVKGTPSIVKDSSATRQKAVFVGGGGLHLRSNSRNGINRDGQHPKTEVSNDASAIKSARSMSKGNRPQTAAVQGSSESIKHNLGSRKNSARSLKHHQESLNVKNKENIKPFDICGPILSHRVAQSNTRNQAVLIDEKKGKSQTNGISQSYEVFQKIAQQMSILQNAKQIQGMNVAAPQFLPRFSDMQDENHVPKFVADMMLQRNDQVSRNPLQKLISQNQLKSSDNFMLAKRNFPHAHDIEPYTVQTSVEFQKPQQKFAKRDPLRSIGCISNTSASHDPSIFNNNGVGVSLSQQPNHSGWHLQMHASNQQQMQSPYTSNNIQLSKGKPQMLSVAASSLVSSKASSSQKNMHSAGQGQGGYKQTTEDKSAVAMKSLEMMEKLRVARQVVRQ